MSGLNKISFILIALLGWQSATAGGFTKPRPLVLWLHGCTQSSQEFLRQTKIQEITESVNPVILAPEQGLFDGPLKCWNWYLPSNQKRGDFLESMVSKIRKHINDGTVDANRVYVGGFSAGGVLASHLAFCYPDIFSGVLVHSAAPYKVLKSIIRGNDSLGKEAYNCARIPLHENRLKKVVVFHGTRDHIAPFFEGVNVVKQAYDYFDLLDDEIKNSSMYLAKHQRVDGYDFYLKDDFQIHFYAINKMKHAWSGGSPNVRFTSPATLSATQTFFDLTDHFGQMQ